MAARKPISLVKTEDFDAITWPDEPGRFTDDHVDQFLLWCVKQNSSDVTIQSERQVYNEIHGTLHPATVRVIDAADMAIFLTKIYGPEAQARLAAAKDLDVSYEIRPDRYTRIRFRVNITAILAKGRDGAQITMRVLPSEPPTMAALSVERDIIDAWAPRQGIVIVTGPTGSGKTTLLAAGNRMMLERPEGCGKMLTYEAPIEYVYDTVESARSIVAQTEIPRHLPNFASGIRNALRRKPEIILVGESRDKETINASIEAAQTGHTVYTTTHTMGVANTVARMISTYDIEEREERAIALMETLRMIVTQSLAPRIGGGRIGVREWMIFPDIVREKLMEMSYTKWQTEIQRMISNYGRTMEKSAEIVYEKGLIDRRSYLWLSSSTGAGV
ncbi:ATPase, T2SS/T4P/T4SS family [Alphaproteobacteria bacterium]|nr:ATPase, T2SS/T4P/T4SS family [Alphaproteobacteria bacterium]